MHSNCCSTQQVFPDSRPSRINIFQQRVSIASPEQLDELQVAGQPLQRLAPVLAYHVDLVPEGLLRLDGRTLDLEHLEHVWLPHEGVDPLVVRHGLAAGPHGGRRREGDVLEVDPLQGNFRIAAADLRNVDRRREPRAGGSQGPFSGPRPGPDVAPVLHLSLPHGAAPPPAANPGGQGGQRGGRQVPGQQRQPGEPRGRGHGRGRSQAGAAVPGRWGWQQVDTGAAGVVAVVVGDQQQQPGGRDPGGGRRGQQRQVIRQPRVDERRGASGVIDEKNLQRRTILPLNLRKKIFARKFEGIKFARKFEDENFFLVSIRSAVAAGISQS